MFYPNNCMKLFDYWHFKAGIPVVGVSKCSMGVGGLVP